MRIEKALAVSFVSLAVFIVAMLSNGCANSDRIDRKPWNSPADWERNTIGVPY